MIRLASLFFMLTVASQLAFAAVKPPLGCADPQQHNQHYLSALYTVKLNGLMLPGTTLFLRRPCGALLVAESDLNRWRARTNDLDAVKIDGVVYINLSAYPGASFSVDESSQLLDLSIALNRLTPIVVDLMPQPGPVQAQSGSGFFINWALAKTWRPKVSLDLTSADLGLGWMLPQGVLLSEWVAASAGGFSSSSRLGTRFVHDDVKRNLRYVAGDTVTDAGLWGQSHNIAGLQLGRDFSLRPGMQIAPVAAMRLLLQDPSRLVLNNQQQLNQYQYPRPVFASSGALPAGELRFTNMPSYQNGQYSLDLLTQSGEQSQTQQPYFFSRGLLREGLNDFSVSAGWRRIGLDDRYRDWLVNATQRVGIRNDWTLEGHAEISAKDRVLGASSLHALPWLGALTATLAFSDSSRVSGSDWFFALGLENRYRWGSYALGVERSGANFVRSFESQAAGTVWRRFFSLGLDLGSRATASLSYAQQDEAGVNSRELVGLSLGWRFLASRRVTLRFNKDLRGSSETDITLGLSFPLADAYSWLPGLSKPRNFNTLYGRLSRTRVDIQSDIAGNAQGSARINIGTGRAENADYWSAGYNTDLLNLDSHGVAVRAGRQYGEAFASLEHNERQGVTSRLGVSGSVVYADQQWFFSRRLYRAMALVHTGAAGKDVRISGFKANSKGSVLVPNLTAYQPARLKVDRRNLPLNTVATIEDVEVVPSFRNIASVQAPIRFRRSATVRVRYRVNGEVQNVPVGASAYLPNQQAPLVVGYEGIIYIEELPPTEFRLRLQWRGNACLIDLRPPATGAADEIPELGPYVCE